MRIALIVTTLLMIGGWSLAGYLINKYKPWSVMGHWLDEKIDQWQGQR